MSYKQLAGFIAYRRRDGGAIEVFLQKRTVDAPVWPSHFSSFGGSVDPDETPDQAVLREAFEELKYRPVNPKKFTIYDDHAREKKFHMYSERVDASFDASITVCEGQYGKWFSEEEMEAELLIPPHMREIIRALFRQLRATD